MRRLSEQEIQRYTALARRRTERNLLRKAIEKKDKVREVRLRRIRKHRYATFSSPIHNLEVPSDLSLESNYDNVVNLVEDLRYIALSRRLRVGIDFTNVQSVGPAAALYLAAEIYRCRYAQTGQLRVTGAHPRNAKVAKLLSDMGFNSLLKIGDPDLSPDSPGTEYIRYKASNNVKGELAGELRLAIEAGSTALAPEIQKAMYGGLTEAMTNVLHHAYPKDIRPRFPVMSGWWWMAGSIERGKREFMIMFYDQGVGIPVTVPRKHPVEIWGGLLSDWGVRVNDANMIKAATLLGVSQTGEKHRGCGLQDIISMVRICKKGDLRILSNRGEYRYTSDGSDECRNHRRNIGGTLIQWRISAPPTTDGQNDDN